MKALLITIVVVGLGVWAILHFGGTTGWDPAAQVAEFNQVAIEGATWQQVADFKEPKTYRRKYMDEEEGPGVAPSTEFNRAKFQERMDGDGFPEGFLFEYAFTSEEVFDVHFGPDGKLAYKEKPVTLGGLLQGKATPRATP